jgi:hypothetical protein
VPRPLLGPGHADAASLLKIRGASSSAGAWLNYEGKLGTPRAGAGTVPLCARTTLARLSVHMTAKAELNSWSSAVSRRKSQVIHQIRRPANAPISGGCLQHAPSRKHTALSLLRLSERPLRSSRGS